MLKLQSHLNSVYIKSVITHYIEFVLFIVILCYYCVKYCFFFTSGSEEDAIESLTDSLSASVRERADKEHKERSCAVLAECTRVLGSATQPKPSRLPRRTVQPETASTVKQVTMHSPQVEPSQLVWEESTKKDAEKHAPTTSKKRQSTQREIQDGVHLDGTLPNLPGTPGRSTMVSQTQPSTSTLVAHTTPLLSKVSAPIPESQASHKMKKSLAATSAARRINRPPVWNKPTLEAAHEILANEIVSDLVSVGAENSSVGSDRSRPQTPEVSTYVRTCVHVSCCTVGVFVCTVICIHTDMLTCTYTYMPCVILYCM